MKSSHALLCADPKRVSEFWPHVQPLLQKAIAHTGLSNFCDIEREILDGNALLWLAVLPAATGYAIEAAAATSLQQTDAGKVCIITACAGRHMANWLPLIAGIEKYAKNEKCQAVRIFGRKGWTRVLDGYEARHVILDKDLR